MKMRVRFLAAMTVFVITGAGFWFRSWLTVERREAREMRALSMGYELRNATNSAMLVGATPEFRADLASVLGQGTWDLIDRSPPRDPWSVVRLVLTNAHGQALHMRLRDEFPSGALRLLSYRRMTEPGGPANRRQPVGPETNRTSRAAGSGG
jgi:hypothetical protein